jgi:hypothetical protein
MTNVKTKVAQQIREAARAIGQKADAIADTAGEYGVSLDIRITVRPDYPAAEINYDLTKLGIPEPELSKPDLERLLGIKKEEKET